MDLGTKKELVARRNQNEHKSLFMSKKKDQTMLQWEKSLQYWHKSKKKQIILLSTVAE
jgi:hypothetical protein